MVILLMRRKSSLKLNNILKVKEFSKHVQESKEIVRNSWSGDTGVC